MEPCPGYKLTKRLGMGGFGDVWEGVSDSTGATVAFKFLNCANQSSTLVVNEIRLLVSMRDLKHPHLIQLFDVISSPNYIILCMERADWNVADLHRAYRDQAKANFPPILLCDVMEQAADALDFIAKQKIQGMGFGSTGLQHCDVKPSNLLMLNNVVKVADFGLSGPQMWNSRSSHFVGTPPYAAPEMYEGRTTERTDVYALAVAYYELRTGYYPFPIPEKLKAPSQPPDLSQLPNEKEKVVLRKALHRQWVDRYPNCLTFAKAIREAMTAGGGNDPLPAAQPKR
jgi:serine/threonine protein kinase